jgi:hypothetical protein
MILPKTNTYWDLHLKRRKHKGGMNMDQTNQPNKIRHNYHPVNYLFHKWFISYNPLYFISALCFIFGVFLVSRGMHKINWIDGQIILTAVIESYEILLLTGSFILYRIVSQFRPAIILALLNIIFLFDCTFQTEHISTVQYLGGISTVLWILLFALKLKILAWIFRLEVPTVGFIAPIFAAIGVAGTPYLLSYTNIDKSMIHLMFTWYGAVLAVLVLWFKPTVMGKSKLAEGSKAILLRVSNAAWMIWSGFYCYHLISWIIFFNIEISFANVAPIFIILPFVSEEEGFTWAGCILAIISSLSNPSLCWLTAFMAGLVFFLKGWKNRQPRLYIGTVLSFHFVLLTLGWQNYPLPVPTPGLAVITGIGLLTIGWVFRLTFAFLIVLFGAILFWNPRGPQNIMEWGSLFIAIGFATLAAGIIMNWKLRFTSTNMEKEQIPLPLKIPNGAPSANIWRRAQDQTERRRKMIKDLKDPCPHCKFNLNSGKDKCDECGMKFYSASR